MATGISPISVFTGEQPVSTLGGVAYLKVNHGCNLAVTQAYHERITVDIFDC